MSTLSLADAKTHLNLTGDTYDVELQEFIDAAESIVEQQCGPLGAESVTDRLRGRTSTLVLKTSPALSLVSVEDVDGNVVDVADLYLDNASGLVTYADGASYFGARSYVVEYEAGRDIIPPGLLMAVREMLRHLWRTQRGSGAARPGTAVESQPAPSYLIPYAVAELMEPYRLPPGVA